MPCFDCPAEKMALDALRGVEKTPEDMFEPREKFARVKELTVKANIIKGIMEDCGGMTEEDIQCPQQLRIDGAYKNVFPAGEHTNND